MLQVSQSGTETRIEFTPGSKLNLATSGEVKAEFANIVKGKNGKLLVDMKNLDYIDSSGVGALLSLLRLCREFGWSLSFTNLQPSVKELFNFLQLTSIFKIV